MTIIHHKRIKRFQIDVKFLDDSDIIRLRAQYENLLTHDMRSKGYARVLDIDPAFSIEFNGETWKFLMRSEEHTSELQVTDVSRMPSSA